MKFENIKEKYQLKDNQIRQISDTEYYITSFGRIINKHGKMLALHIDRNGYSTYYLSIKNKPVFVQLHRLVLENFNPISNMNNLFVNHKDGNKSNNNLENLEWVTRSENTKHSFKNQLQTQVTNQYGTYHVLTEEERIFIKNNYNILGIKNLANKFNVCERTIRKYKNYGE